MRAVRHALVLALACVFVDSSVACKACTLIGCGSGLSLELVPAGPRFDSGSYTLTWVADEASGACEFEVADDARCPEWQPELCVIAPMCMAALDDRDGRVEIQLEETPASLQVTLELGDRVLIDAELEPDYSVSQPNGPGCEPVCTQATVPLEAT